MADTRKDKRAALSLKVRFKSATLDEFVEQYSYDISRGGIFIKSKKPMNVGTLLKFEFQLKDESPLIHGVGRVVWKREAAEGEASPGMGIKFIKMDPDSRALVQQIVEERGNQPGTFEEGETGGGDSFFPETNGGEDVAPEDRTQVRHASEFLADALSETDSAAAEAEENAAEARKRTEEIQKEREEREKERLKAESGVAMTEGDASSEDEEVGAALKDVPVEEDVAGDSETILVTTGDQTETSGEKTEAKSETKAEKKPALKVEKAALSTSEPARPQEKSGGGMMWVVALLLAAAIGGYFVWRSTQGEPEPELSEEVSVDTETELAEIGVVANTEAAITLDGVPAGTVGPESRRIEVEPGQTLEATARGFLPLEVRVAEEDLELELEAMPWILRVAGPEGGEFTVQINGEDVSTVSYEEAPEEPIAVVATFGDGAQVTETITEANFEVVAGEMLALVQVAPAEPEVSEVVEPAEQVVSMMAARMRPTRMSSPMRETPMDTEAAPANTAQETGQSATAEAEGSEAPAPATPDSAPAPASMEEAPADPAPEPPEPAPTTMTTVAPGETSAATE